MKHEQRLMELLEKEGERVIGLCQDLVRIPSEDPPGDTRDIACFIFDCFRNENVECEIVDPHPEKPNVVARVKGEKPGRKVVFNGHMDTFPVGDKKRWSYDPFGGNLVDGRIYGRGSSDMKGGLAASILSLILLNRLRDELPGTVSITCVSDEEVFGPWGSQYLLKEHEDLRGDALINGEPSSLENIRIGEKGQYWFRFSSQAEGGHGAYAGLRSSAVRDIMKLLGELERFPEDLSRVPDSIVEIMREGQECYDRLLCPGATKAALEASMNIGTIRGGLSVNMIAEECTAEVDFRLPPGVKGSLLRDWVREVVKDNPSCTAEEFNSYDAFLTEPSHELVRIARSTAEEILGRTIYTSFSLGGTEARLWREWGVPAVTYGPNHHNMGSADEYVVAEELLSVVKVQAMTALRFLLSREGEKQDGYQER